MKKWWAFFLLCFWGNHTIFHLVFIQIEINSRNILKHSTEKKCCQKNIVQSEIFCAIVLLLCAPDTYEKKKYEKWCVYVTATLYRPYDVGVGIIVLFCCCLSFRYVWFFQRQTKTWVQNYIMNLSRLMIVLPKCQNWRKEELLIPVHYLSASCRWLENDSCT